MVLILELKGFVINAVFHNSPIRVYLKSSSKYKFVYPLFKDKLICILLKTEISLAHLVG